MKCKNWKFTKNKLLKQVQSLPERTANEATCLLMGRIPVIGELHKRILKTFDNIIRKDNSIETDIALRQLALKGQNSDSWVSKLDEISEKYILNSTHDLIVNHLQNCHGIDLLAPQ
jgi:hypothetical protein